MVKGNELLITGKRHAVLNDVWKSMFYPPFQATALFIFDTFLYGLTAIHFDLVVINLERITLKKNNTRDQQKHNYN
jgi:hypothetical protein